jgi:hypothetical protein
MAQANGRNNRAARLLVCRNSSPANFDERLVEKYSGDFCRH